MGRAIPSVRLLRQLAVIRGKANTCGDDETKAALASLGCVFLSGYIEKRFEEIVGGFIEGAGGHAALRRVASPEARLMNANIKKLENRLSTFSEGWALDFVSRLDANHRSAIDSVVATRNAIAHGGAQSVTWDTLDIYERDVVAALDHLEQVVV